MATEQKIPIGTTGENLRSFEQTTTAGTVQVEAISVVDPTDPSAIQKVTNTTPGSSDYGAVVRIAGTQTIDVQNRGTLSTANSTETLLGSNATYTGTFEEITNYGIIFVAVKANVASATNGFRIDFSHDGVTNDGSTDTYDIAANTLKEFSFNPAARYFRVVYINGSSAQSSFFVQTIYKSNGLASSHKVSEIITDNTDSQMVKAILTAKRQDGNYGNIACNNNNRLFVTNDSAYAEDSGSTTGDIGSFILGVRNASQATLTNTELDYSAFSVDSLGNTIQTPKTTSVALTDSNSNTINLRTNAGGTGVIDVIYPTVFNGTTWDRLRGTTAGVNAVPAASATTTGTTPYSNTALSNTKQAVKASSGRLYGYHINNPNTSTVYIQFFDVASAGVTVGTTTPTFVLTIPANATSPATLDCQMAVPISFGTAITIAATTTATGSTAPSTALCCALFYV